MTQDQKRIKIAEACGWSRCISREDDEGRLWVKGVRPGRTVKDHYEEIIPNCFNDLNACREMENAPGFDLTNSAYAKNLCAIVLGFDVVKFDSYAITLNWWSLKRVARATAAQRCEALGRTLNLWEAGE